MPVVACMSASARLIASESPGEETGGAMRCGGAPPFNGSGVYSSAGQFLVLEVSHLSRFSSKFFSVPIQGAFGASARISVCAEVE